MTTADLIAELNDLGIRLEARGERLRYSPRSAMTPELTERLKAHKPALLEMLTASGSPELENLKQKNEPTLGDLDADPWDSAIDAGELDSCPKCGSLELWESMLGNWRCMRCEFPKKAERWNYIIDAFQCAQ